MTGHTAARRLRIAVGGLGTESSTFAPHTMGREEFHPLRGVDIARELPFLEDGTFPDVDWVPTLHAWGSPSGPIPSEIYDELEEEILSGLREAGPLDGVLLDLHGAMFVTGRRCCEERLLGAVRAVVGSAPLISLSMDPHGNMSRELAGLIDLATCYRLAPHRDKPQTRARAAQVLVEALREGLRPIRYWVDVPMLLNGERTSTDVEPGASVFPAAEAIRQEPSIIDAGIWVGFAWADEERCRASVLVTGTSPGPARRAAEGLANSLWTHRHDFDYVAPRSGSFEEALLLASDQPSNAGGPLVISDSGDNVTAGAPGDATDTLRLLLASPLAPGAQTVLYAGIPDHKATALCVEAGIGSTVDLELGGHIETRYGSPVCAAATVLAVAPERDRPRSVLVDIEGVQVIISARRSRWTEERAFTDLGVDAAALDVLVVKNGYLFPYQRLIASDWFLAITPGATDLDHTRLRYRNLAHPLFPFEDDQNPALNAHRIP